MQIKDENESLSALKKTAWAGLLAAPLLLLLFRPITPATETELRAGFKRGEWALRLMAFGVAGGIDRLAFVRLVDELQADESLWYQALMESDWNSDR